MELNVLSCIDLYHHFNGNVRTILACSFSFLFIDIFGSGHQIGGFPKASKKDIEVGLRASLEFKKK